MYFPYLRAKQNELLVLREESLMLARQKNIIPIVEPVKKDRKALLTAVTTLNKALAPYILIVNPQNGELVREGIDVNIETKLAPNNNAFLGFIINYKTTLDDIKSFLNDYQDYNVSLIHSSEFRDEEALFKLLSKHSNIAFHIFIDGEVSQFYQDSFRDANRVIIKDSFRKAVRNSDYAQREDEFFSDSHLNYKKLGYQGFGDFTIIGKEYNPKGGAAYSVAIHYTYPHEAARTNIVRIKHFVSDKLPDSNLDTPGKFLEALKKLINFLNKNPSLVRCDSCKEFQFLHEIQSYPQLGYVKKLSIKHHIQVIKDLI